MRRSEYLEAARQDAQALEDFARFKGGIGGFVTKHQGFLPDVWLKDPIWKRKQQSLRQVWSLKFFDDLPSYKQLMDDAKLAGAFHFVNALNFLSKERRAKLCEHCHQPLFATTLNQKYHRGTCRQTALGRQASKLRARHPEWEERRKTKLLQLKLARGVAIQRRHRPRRYRTQERRVVVGYDQVILGAYAFTASRSSVSSASICPYESTVRPYEPVVRESILPVKRVLSGSVSCL